MVIARPITRTLISTVGWGIPITDEVNALRAELNALKAAPKVTTFYFQQSQLSYTTTGLRDFMAMNVGTLAVASKVNFHTVVYAGFGSPSNSAASTDLWGYAANASITYSGSPVYAGPAAVAPLIQLVQLDLAAGQDAGAKLRLNVQIVSGTFYAQGWGIVTIVPK